MVKDIIAEKIKNCKFLFEERKDEEVPLYAYPAYMKQQNLPMQGFKIHVSATFMNADKIFDAAIPYLLKSQTAFKVVLPSQLLRLLNEDRFGYSQVGKFITVYPHSIAHFVKLVHEIDNLLQDFEAPAVPSDIRFHDTSIVYYRYGVITNPDNELRLPSGETIKDERDPNTPIPKWIRDPIQQYKPLYPATISKKLLCNRYIILKILRQRAKGIVAIALDLENVSLASPKVIILKEARALGALGEQGIDAISRLEKEFTLMQKIAPLNICPTPIKFIKNKDRAFLSMEFLENESLGSIILEKKSIPQATLIRLCIKIGEKLSKLHARSIYVADISPTNILIGTSGEVLFVDFEYAVYDEERHFEGWEVGTPGFYPKATLLEDIDATLAQKLVYKDLFAFGNVVLAVLDPKWYHSIAEAKHAFLLVDGSWNIPQALAGHSELVRSICQKTNLLSSERYASVDELIQDLQRLATNIEYGYNQRDK